MKIKTLTTILLLTFVTTAFSSDINLGAGAGTGDVTGPASSTDNAIVRFHETGGKTLQDSGVTIDDSNHIAGAASLTVNRSATPTVALGDSDATDSDVNVKISANCTNTGSGTENCDLTLWQQIGGVLIALFNADADGDLSFYDRNIVTTGQIQGAVKGGTSTGGALTINAVTIATAAADYDLPDSCDSATFAWAMLYVRDAAETASLTVTDTSDTIIYKGLSLGANDELDSPGAALDSVVVVCMETNNWYVTANSGDWADGGVP